MSRADEAVVDLVGQGTSTNCQDTGTAGQTSKTAGQGTGTAGQTSKTAGQGTGTTGQYEENVETQVEEATIRFKVERISHLKDRRHSKIALVHSLPWRIRLVPKHLPSKKSLGFFLQCSGDPDSPSWSCSVQAVLRLVSQKEGVKDVVRTITHVFNNTYDDWGYEHFTIWSNAIDPEKGFCKDDTIICEVCMKAEEPRGVSWDTKEHSDGSDLGNRRSMCHMDSVLQTLFFTNELRKPGYQMPNKDGELSTSVTEVLQKVLREWQFNDKPISMKRLTEWFGLATLNPFMKQNITELCRGLFDNLEFQVNGTCVHDTIQTKLNEGSIITTITCKRINYQLKCIEPFYEIQLNAKGKKNIVDSVKEYCAKETLDGDSKYDAGTHGLQDAEKSIIFKSLPPVLHLYLLRCQSDNRTSKSDIGISNRYEFSEKLDLSEFLEQKEDTPAHYTLHAVIVHSADEQDDHYAAFINTKCEGNWCKFDDSDDLVVSLCTKQEATEHNFGARSGDEVTINRPRSVNACMLVYIRDSALPDVLQKVEKVDIPKQLMKRLQKQLQIETQRNEVHLYTQVQVVLEEHFYLHHGADLIDPDKCNYRNFKVRKTATVSELTELISARIGLPVTAIRPWRMTLRANQTFRPTVIDEADMSRHVQDLLDQTGPLTLFVETVNPNDSDTNLPVFDRKSDVLLFFKLYDPCKEEVSYIGHQYVPIQTTPDDLTKVLNKLAGFSQSTSLLLFEEVKPNLVERIVDTDKPLKIAINELTNGDIICFQKSLSHQTASLKLPTVREYFTQLLNRVKVRFCDKSNPKDVCFALELPLRMSYEEIASAVALRLQTDSKMLKFFKTQSYCDENSLYSSFNGNARALCRGKHQGKIYFQRLSMHIDEF